MALSKPSGISPFQMLKLEAKFRCGDRGGRSAAFLLDPIGHHAGFTPAPFARSATFEPDRDHGPPEATFRRNFLRSSSRSRTASLAMGLVEASAAWKVRNRGTAPQMLSPVISDATTVFARRRIIGGIDEKKQLHRFCCLETTREYSAGY